METALQFRGRAGEVKLSAMLSPMPRLLFLLLLLCYGFGNVHCSTVDDKCSGDLHALLDFRRGITHAPRRALDSWRNETHFCQWFGVNCTAKRRVSSLELTGLGLVGHISSSLGNLTFLTSLDLSSNNFVDPLPVLGHLQHLHTLSLEDNSLNGAIPDSLTNCSNLTNLDLHGNLLVGGIPPKLGSLSSMFYLDLSGNSLVGPIPDELGKLTGLNHLSLRENKLTGQFPHAILNLSASLQYLDLGFNMLGKALPPNVGDRLPNLVEVSLWTNTFEGHIPSSLGNATSLETIDLSENNFTGKIPTSLRKLTNLSYLYLDGNRIEARNDEDWEFLNALTNCRSLNTLLISGNQLQGSIPQSIGNLSHSLQYLYLDGNSFLGQVPKSIGKLSGITFLGLGRNDLSGTIEGWIGNITNLQMLDLQSNSYTGPIPSSLGNITHLTSLFLEGNSFTGPIPESLGNLPLRALDLSKNNLQGYIPPNFGNLQQLEWLNLANNNFQGGITQLGNLHNLQNLYLSSNNFTGGIYRYSHTSVDMYKHTGCVHHKFSEVCERCNIY